MTACIFQPAKLLIPRPQIADRCVTLNPVRECNVLVSKLYRKRNLRRLVSDQQDVARIGTWRPARGSPHWPSLDGFATFLNQLPFLGRRLIKCPSGLSKKTTTK